MFQYVLNQIEPTLVLQIKTVNMEKVLDTEEPPVKLTLGILA